MHHAPKTTAVALLQAVPRLTFDLDFHAATVDIIIESPAILCLKVGQRTHAMGVCLGVSCLLPAVLENGRAHGYDDQDLEDREESYDIGDHSAPG